jgi:hypothetical protein
VVGISIGLATTLGVPEFGFPAGVGWTSSVSVTVTVLKTVTYEVTGPGWLWLWLWLWLEGEPEGGTVGDGSTELDELLRDGWESLKVQVSIKKLTRDESLDIAHSA